MKKLPVLKKLPRILKKRRFELDMTMRDVRDKSGGFISHSYLANIEAGKVKEVTPAMLRHLSRGLALDYMDLMMAAGYIRKSDLK